MFVFRTVRQSGGHRRLPWGSAHLTLAFDERGVEISGSRPGERSVVPWSSVLRVSRGATERAPDGGSVTVIGIESPGRIMRFVVTSHRRDPIELAALADQIQRWSEVARPEVARPEVARPEVARAPDPGLTSDGVPHVPVVASMSPVDPGGRGGRVRGMPRRTRRVAVLLVGLAFLISGVGLALALAASGPPPPVSAPATARPTPDQVLAQRLLLTRGDLPAGWTVSSDPSRAGSSPRVRSGESVITQTFARCMGISRSQASLALGGGATDQTAQTTSPVFLAPTSPDRPGFALELQTAGTVVRTDRDEQHDFSLFADPHYPQCAGAAVAAETQLGADGSSGMDEQPGPDSVTAVALSAPAGEQVAAVLVSFTVTDRSASVPVEVETVSLGHDRIEANLQALAIGGQIPSGVLASTVSAFEQRVVTDGQSAQV